MKIPSPSSVLRGLVLGLAASVFLVAGCSRQEHALTTGATVEARALPGTFHGDATYAIVRADALPALHENFAAVLSNQGLVQWDSRYDCNHFAALWVSLAQARYAAAAWHSDTKAQTLALAEVWFYSASGGHAIVAAVTDRGLVYLEPQTGREITLPPVARLALQKW